MERCVYHCLIPLSHDSFPMISSCLCVWLVKTVVKIFLSEGKVNGGSRHRDSQRFGLKNGSGIRSEVLRRQRDMVKIGRNGREIGCSDCIYIHALVMTRPDWSWH